MPALHPTCTSTSFRSCPVSNPFTHSQWPRLSDILNENDPFGKAGFLGAERKPSKVNHQNHVLGYHLKTFATGLSNPHISPLVRRPARRHLWLLPRPRPWARRHRPISGCAVGEARRKREEGEGGARIISLWHEDAIAM